MMESDVGQDGVAVAERGHAVLVAIMALLLMSALGAAVVVNSSTETRIAGNMLFMEEALYAADGALERAVAELAILADWSAALDGRVQSSFVDGPSAGVRSLADGSLIDLAQVQNRANCQKTSACTANDLIAVTASRPWGPNNPVWRLYAHGPLAAMLSGPAITSPCYVVVLVADDPSENDGDPLRDGRDLVNPGSGIVLARAEAFGPRGSHAVVEATVTRVPGASAGAARSSWRVLR